MKGISLDVFSVSQPIGTFYVGVTSARALLSICQFDYRRMAYSKNGYVEFLGIQRQVNERRAKDIAQYSMTSDACFPTSVVISIPEHCARLEQTYRDVWRLHITEYLNDEDPVLSIPLDQVGTIIDGQHRLKGLEESLGNDIDLPVAFFIGADDATEATIFSVVNLAQTKVNKSLVYDLFALQKTRSPEKTAHEVVVALDRFSGSPFERKVKRLGVATEGRFGETLSQATMVRGLLPYITSDAMADRDKGRRFGFWDDLPASQSRRRIFYELFRNNRDEYILANMLNYFSAIRSRWPGAWNRTGTGNMINRTNGYNAFMRFLRPAYLNFTQSNEVVSEVEYRSLFDRSNLQEGDFNTRRFVPGSSGEKELYGVLIRDTGIADR